MTTLIQELAHCIPVMKSIQDGTFTTESAENAWRNRFANAVNKLPSGSGFDSGSSIDLDASTQSKIVIDTSFHHMTEGMYDGWTDHKVVVVATFDGFDLRVTGRDRNMIKEYIGDLFYDVLSEEIEDPLPAFQADLVA